MKRHSFICRYGLFDKTKISVVDGDSAKTTLQFVQTDRQFAFAIGDTLSQLLRIGIHPSETAFDLLAIAATVYGADTRINRHSEAQDSWSREIDIYIPVSQLELWNGCSSLLSKTLGFLSGDSWRFFFRKRPKGFSSIIKQGRLRLRDAPTSTCLFSGGLDSFIGAIDLLEETESPLLVSHSWVKNVSGGQSQCIDVLERQYGAKRVQRLASRIGFANGLVNGVGEENTERSRSFLFFTLAAFAASGFGHENVVINVPENGLISLNVPLDPLRLGSLSTRTTHPYYMVLYNQLLESINIPARVVNRYNFKTKGEMVEECKNGEFLRQHATITMSCSSPTKGRWKGLPAGHCGYCLPCIIRRASLLHMEGGDLTNYHLNLRGKVLDSLKAEGDHVRSFLLALNRLGGSLARARVLIHKSGPLPMNDQFLEDAAQLYLRGMNEVAELLDGVQTAPNGIPSR